MESSLKDKNYIASVISSVKSSFSGSDIDQELLIKLEQKWIEKLKIIDEEAEKAAGNLLIWKGKMILIKTLFVCSFGSEGG